MPKSASTVRVTGRGKRAPRVRREVSRVLVPYAEFRERRLEAEGKRDRAYSTTIVDASTSAHGALFSYSFAYEGAHRASLESTVARIMQQLREDQKRREK